MIQDNYDLADCTNILVFDSVCAQHYAAYEMSEVSCFLNVRF